MSWWIVKIGLNFAVWFEYEGGVEERTKSVLSSIRRILRAADTNSKTLMRASGITPSQLVLLRLLDEGGERSAGQIAQSMGITQATTTGLVHKLEARGLIERKRGETDKRQVWLSLTDAGHAALSQSPDGIHERFEQEFEELSDWEQSMLIASLERIAAMLDGGQEDVAPIFDAAELTPFSKSEPKI